MGRIIELVFRARQELRKRLERLGVIGYPPSRPRAMLLDRIRGAASVRFFEGAASARTAALLDGRAPGARERLEAAADAICQGRFDLLGYRNLSFGDPVDWNLDPVSGRRAPLVHWSRLDPLDAATVGDCRVVWELNRHQWLVRLGQAYRLTGEERYADAFAGYVWDWLLANPPGQGINWTSSLEVALRLISWCWTLVLFRDARALSPALFGEMLRAIWAHAAHVERNLSYYVAPDTRLTGEALGLFYAGVVVPEFRRARRWRTLGARILVEASARQVLPDGVHVEPSTGFARCTAETYLHFLILAALNRVAVPPAVAERVQRLLDFLLAVRHPDGSVPGIGDADGGWRLPLADRGPDDFQGLFATAAAVFDRPDYAWAAPEPAPEPLWLLGPAGLDALAALRPAPPPTAPSRLFADGGYAVMRGGWDAGSAA